MAKLTLLGRILLVLIGWHVMQTNAYFDITLEAINVSNKFIAELQKNYTFANEHEMLDKIYNFTDIIHAFYDKARNTEEHIVIKEYLESFEIPNSLNDLLSKYNGIVHRIERVLEERRELVAQSSRPDIFGFIYNAALHSTHSDLETAPKEMHELVTRVDDESGQSILSYSASKKFRYSTANPYSNVQSHHQLVLNVGLNIARLDASVFTLKQYYVACLKIFHDGKQFLGKDHHLPPVIWKWINNTDVAQKLSKEKRDFEIRNSETYKNFIAAITPLPREKWNRGWREDWTYNVRLYLDPIFQRYIVNEIDIHASGYCKGECQDYKRAYVLRCSHGNNDICGHQNKCKGTLWECDNKFSNNSAICAEDGRISWRNIEMLPKSRYRNIENNGKLYGESDTKTTTCDSNTIRADSWYYWSRRCDYCRCVCENPEINTDRHFNLRSVISDVDQNYVVTGVKFEIENHVFHIKIQQGKLRENRMIDLKSINWMPIDNYTISDDNVTAEIDYHTISWKERTIALDILESPKKNQVLTGFRFNRVDDFLRLEIHVTPFDYASGKLLPKNSFWYFNDARIKDRKELKFDLQENEYNLVNPTVDGYIKFAPDFDEINVGQVTIPYLEYAKLNDILPIKGAGIYMRKDEPRLKLKLVDFENN